MKLENKKLKTAGILLIISGVLSLIMWIVALSIDSINIGNGGVYPETYFSIIRVFATIGIIMSVFPIIGGLLILKNKRGYITILCCIIGILSIGPIFISSILSIISLILIIITKNDFYSNIEHNSKLIRNGGNKNEKKVLLKELDDILKEEPDLAVEDVKQLLENNEIDLARFRIKRIKDMEGERTFLKEVDKFQQQNPTIIIDDLKQLIKRNMFDEAVRKFNNLMDDFDRFKKLQSELKEIKEKIKKLTGRIAVGELDSEAYKRALNDLEMQKKEIEEELWNLRNKLLKDEYEKPF